MVMSVPVPCAGSGTTPGERNADLRPKATAHPHEVRPSRVTAVANRDRTRFGASRMSLPPSRVNASRRSYAADATSGTAPPVGVQFKLDIGSIHDPLEAEADAAADAVMRMPQSRAPAQAEAAHARRKCAACEEEEPILQAKPAAAHKPGGPVPPSVHQVVTSSGQPLDRQTRSFFEPRFGRDLSGVRIHTDSDAAASARSVGALAYTVGSHVVFGPAQYSPNTDSGRRLVAHELAHVFQQGSAGETIQRSLARDAGPRADAAAVDKVVAALQEPQENGVGNYQTACDVLNGMWMAVMLPSLEQLQQRGFFELLQGNCPTMPRVQAALAAVSAKGTPAAGRIDADPAFAALPEPQQHEVATYLSLPWPIRQQPKPSPAASGLTTGEVLAVIAITAVVVGAVVLLTVPGGQGGGVAILAIVLSTGAGDATAGVVIAESAEATVALVTAGEATATGTVLATTETAAAAAETAAATTTAAEATAATTTSATTSAATTTAAETAAATTTSSAATIAAVTTAGLATASTTISTDSPSAEDKKKPDQPCQVNVIYSQLDNLGRAGPVSAVLANPLPPGQEPVENPSGWATPNCGSWQKDLGGMEQARGHLLAKTLGGKGTKDNLVVLAQSKNLEMFHQFERQVKRYVESNADACVQYLATPVYDGDWLCPGEIVLSAVDLNGSFLLNLVVANSLPH